MKVVIDISNEDYKNLCDSHITYDIKLLSKQSSKDVENTMMILNLIDATKNGKPLPKGHGRLIDADAKNKELTDDYHGMISDESMKIYKIIQMLDDAPTIIEADKEMCDGEK